MKLKTWFLRFGPLSVLALASLLLGACEAAPVGVSPTATLFMLPTQAPPTEIPPAPILGSISTPTTRAMTLVPTASPTVRATVILTPPSVTPQASTTLSPTSAADCVPDALFLEDVTIPDDTVLRPGGAFTKTWRMQNTGSCDWIDVKLVFLQGTQMAASGEIPVRLTKVGDKVDISVKMTAPAEPGMHFGIWQLRGADGRLFGMQPYLRIIVGDQQATPTTFG